MPDTTFERAFLVTRANDVLALASSGPSRTLPALSSTAPAEVTAAARDATKLVTASGADGGLDVRCVRSIGQALPARYADCLASARVGVARDDATRTALAASLCVALTDTWLATGHQSGVVRTLHFDQ